MGVGDITAFPNGISGIGGMPLIGGGGPVGYQVGQGQTYIIDPDSGSDNNDGKSMANAFATLTPALAAMVNFDTTYCLPGDYSGNFDTPINSVAKFCSLIGVNPGGMGFGAWAVAGGSTPWLTVHARGWRIHGFEVEGNATAGCIQLRSSGTSNGNYTQIDGCHLTGGAAGSGVFGIDWYGAPTYTRIIGNILDFFDTSAFTCTNSGGDTPQLAYIAGNRFNENNAHMDMTSGGGNRGFKTSLIVGNYFNHTGLSRTTTPLINNTGGAGCDFSGNHLGITNSEWAADTLVIFAASDSSQGNMLEDGLQTAEPAP